MCQPLLDAVAAHLKSPMLNHTLQRTFGPAVRALHGPPLRSVNASVLAISFTYLTAVIVITLCVSYKRTCFLIGSDFVVHLPIVITFGIYNDKTYSY